MSGFRARTALVAATVVVVASALTGCSGGEPELAASAAKQLQTGVLTVTTSAADGDFAAAQTALAKVRADVHAAAAAGDVTTERAKEIQAAIKLVAADLKTAIAKSKPTPTKPPEPTEEPAPSEEPTTEPEPTEEPTTEPEPEPVPEPTIEPVPEPTIEPAPEPTIEPTAPATPPVPAP